ncbi:glutathione S-transferase [Roseovarius sp. SCSIO 43702]|uniref:glutathione S-transferase n=1 Tax=Roseovarius sp. SCSIO 43702 TaxID=2823043 RepID=UPI001C72A2F5|nr:glutathione S-transferase [Roseovarius sp. SCSIO 43702]QYX57675.1 glutathione S-transferase [Roseovarius sp. SCSIO 43702]
MPDRALSPERPILWSFRRCPYAIRARLAVAVAGVPVELREVVLRDKPAAFLEASPTGTVPCLETDAGVIDESLDIMLWALRRNDPEGWLAMPHEGRDLIERSDGPFKQALDRYKYATRHPEADPLAERAKAGAFLADLDTRLAGRGWLLGTRPCLADMAILPFVRQFAHVDRAWFEAQPWVHLVGWLADFKSSARFKAVMSKHPQWQPGEVGATFP